MRRFRYSMFIILTFTAIIVAGTDYVCGHCAENPFRPVTCPLCNAFQCTEFHDANITDLLSADTASVVGIVSLPDTQFEPSTTSPSCQLRAPPCRPA